MADSPTDRAASVRSRLSKLSRATGQPFELVLTPPDALTPAFAEDAIKQRQWAAFAADVPGAPARLREVVESLAAFLMDAAADARDLEAKP